MARGDLVGSRIEDLHARAAQFLQQHAFART